MSKFYLIILIIIIFGVGFYLAVASNWLFPPSQVATTTPPGLISFAVARPNLVVKARGLDSVSIWGQAAGAGETVTPAVKIGQAELASVTSSEQTWIMAIPALGPIYDSIYAQGFYEGAEIGRVDLAARGESEIYNALWGKPAASQYDIIDYDAGRFFSYPLTATFTVMLDGTRYQPADLKCEPAGIISAAAPAVQPPLFAAPFAAVATGTCILTVKDFEVIIKVYAPGSESFVNEDYGWELTYPSYLVVTDRDSEPFLLTDGLVRLDLPANFYPQSNLSEAALIIGASTSPAIAAKCLAVQENETQAGKKEIGGREFTNFTALGAAAGNRYETNSYRYLAGNTCFEAVQLLHYGEILNYPPDTVQEFNRNDIKMKLDQVLSGLKPTNRR